MVRGESLLGELTLAREEALRIGLQEVPAELRSVKDLEHGDYGNFIHGIYFHMTTREDIVRDIGEVCVSFQMMTTLDSDTESPRGGCMHSFTMKILIIFHRVALTVPACGQRSQRYLKGTLGFLLLTILVLGCRFLRYLFDRFVLSLYLKLAVLF